MNKKEYETMIDEKLALVKEELMEEFKEESESKYPEYGTCYYSVNPYGAIYKERWTDSTYDKKKFNIGNYFETQEAVKFEVERLKVIAELKHFAEPKGTIWKRKYLHWSFVYDNDDKRLVYVSSSYFINSCFYFSTEQEAKKAVETIGEDRIKKYYLEVE